MHIPSRLSLEIAQYDAVRGRFLGKNTGVIRGAASFPLFGRLRRDFDVEALVGAAEAPSIMLPVQLSLVDDTCGSFKEVITTLRHTERLAQILGNQSAAMRNSYLHRVALITHVFLRVLPLPLPHTHPRHEAQCFWASAMSYAEQAALLRLLEQLSRHFASAALAVRDNESGDTDAARVLVAAAIAALTDCVLRARTTDHESEFCRHYTGRADGPTWCYGFDAAYFAVDSELGLLIEPEFATAREQLLSYFEARSSEVRQHEEHLLFSFESSMSFGAAEQGLVRQLALSLGYDSQPLSLARYLSGEEPALLDACFELGVLRDVVFLFKMMMMPTAPMLPPCRAWAPRDAMLSWAAREEKGGVSLRAEAFGMELQGAWTSGGGGAGVLGWLRKLVGKEDKMVLKCTIKNFPYKSFYNPEKNEVYTYYRQGQAFIVDAADCSKWSYNRMTEMDIGQMYLIYN